MPRLAGLRHAPGLGWLTGALVVVLLAFSTGGCRREATQPPLIVGMELSYPPFETIDENGQPAGVSVDLARALATYLGRDLRIENIAFAGLIPALKTGRIHLILSSLTQTPERAESILFSDPYLETGLCLLVPKSSEVQSAADLNRTGRRVAVKKGTTGEAYAVQHLAKAQVLVLDQEAAAVLEVIQGKVDAFLYDQISVFQHGRRNPETTRALLKPFQVEHWAIGLRHGDEALRDQVNTFLQGYRADGGFERLGQHWLQPQMEAFREQGLPFFF